MLAVAGRFVIRLRLWAYCQKRRSGRPPPSSAFRFGADDGFLLAGLACAAAATALPLRFADELFLAEALTVGLPDPHIPDDFVQRALHFKRWSVVYGVLSWLAVCASKFSFLCFIRQLIDRVPGRIVAWWRCVVLFCAATAVWCSVSYVIACPYEDFERARMWAFFIRLSCVLAWLWIVSHDLFTYCFSVLPVSNIYFAEGFGLARNKTTPSDRGNLRQCHARGGITLAER